MVTEHVPRPGKDMDCVSQDVCPLGTHAGRIGIEMGRVDVGKGVRVWATVAVMVGVEVSVSVSVKVLVSVGVRERVEVYVGVYVEVGGSVSVLIGVGVVFCTLTQAEMIRLNPAKRITATRFPVCILPPVSMPRTPEIKEVNW